MATRIPSLITPPKTCDCGNPANLTQIQVIHQASGKTLTGSFSQFGAMVGKDRKLVLKPDYIYQKWIARCWDCQENPPQKELAI